MYKHLKISPHKHTGHLQPHEHTSYLPLAILVLCVGIVLFGYSVSTYAADPPPQAGSVGLTGEMPKAPPTTAATISSPAQNQHFTTSPIVVAGSCPKGTLVELYKNDIFAGSTPCDNNGNFSISIDLLIGKNDLIARVYDSLDQAGPDSNTVTVYYDIVPTQSAAISFLNLSGPQMLLETDAVYRGSFPGQLLNIPITIVGGTPPYAINIQWGDSSNSVIPRSNNLTFNAGHTYQKPGTYEVIIQGSDSQQRVAFLQVVTIINGQPVIAASTTPQRSATNWLLILWPFFAIAATMVVSFWLGEKREKHILAASTAQS